jgi:hypothetical protein
MMPVLADKYGSSALQALSSEQKDEAPMMDFGKLCVHAVFRSQHLPLKGNGVVLCVQISPEEYFLLACQCDLSLSAGDAKHLDILAMEEGSFIDGVWHRGRRLNGDEVATLTVESPKLMRLKIHTYNDY